MRKNMPRYVSLYLASGLGKMTKQVEFSNLTSDSPSPMLYVPGVHSEMRLEKLIESGRLVPVSIYMGQWHTRITFRYVPETVDVTVYHKLRTGGMIPVAIVHLPRVGKTHDLVERAYVLTQHAFDSWYNNPEVTVLLKSRSSAVEDVFVLDGLACVCVAFGWSTPGIFTAPTNPDFIGD